MSNTPRFLHLGKWPAAFCGMGDGTGLGFEYLDNLNEADVMAFAWSTETLTITTAGTVSNGTSSANIANTMTVDGSGISATLYDEGGASGMWCPTTSVWTAWGSFPANKIPRKRACAPALISGLLGNVFAISGRLSTNPSNTFFGLSFYVGPDPVNTGKFILYYTFTFTVYGSAGGGDWVQMDFQEADLGGSVANGSVTLGGFTFNWWAYISGTGTPAVGTTPSLTGSTSTYTYV